MTSLARADIVRELWNAHRIMCRKTGRIALRKQQFARAMRKATALDTDGNGTIGGDDLRKRLVEVTGEQPKVVA